MAADGFANVIMPVLGMSQDSGTILRWLKAEGQPVQQGEPLMEVETDKAVAEIEAPASGVLAQILTPEGITVPVTQVVARIRTAETSPRPEPLPVSPLARRVAAENQVDLDQVRPVDPHARRIEKEHVLAYLETRQREQVAQPAINPGKILASPKARRLAAELSIALSAVKGSGPEGAVLASDLAALQPMPVSQPVEAPDRPAPPVQEIPMSPTWARMVARITQSWTSVPHFYLTREVNAARLIAWREQLNRRAVAKITYTDLLVKLAAAALREHPRVNSWFREGKIWRQEGIHIGLAVALEEGLVVPVVHHADALSVSQIAAERTRLVERARAGRLSLDDLQGGTFTISNLGMYGVDAFNALINPPQAAILAVGRIAERVLPLRGQPIVQPAMTLTASFDHRVVDGAQGASFLSDLADWIEEPLGLLD